MSSKILTSFCFQYIVSQKRALEETITKQLMAFDLSMKVVKNNSTEILGLLEKMVTRMNGQEDEIKCLSDQIRVLNGSRKL